MPLLLRPHFSTAVIVVLPTFEQITGRRGVTFAQFVAAHADMFR
ncbi:hypothetical protein [Nocardia sp. CNY236]|nr:hypothetical protein [Nocardia sp. CNY236]